MTLESIIDGSFRISFAGLTDVGRVRGNNEDYLVMDPSIGIFGVCDGMGGHAAGEIASSVAAKSVIKSLRNAERKDHSAVRAALEEANTAILQSQRENPAWHGMATTMSFLWIPDSGKAGGWVGHIGDSRIYQCRKEELQLLTRDQTPVFRLYERGVISRSEMDTHPSRNLVERALGIEPQIEPEVFALSLQAGDLYLACSDGLTTMVPEPKIVDMLGRRTDDMQALCRDLIEQANKSGGLDNITVAVVEIT